MLGSKRCKAVMVRSRTKVASANPPAVLAAARDLRQRSFGQATAKYRELGTMANLLAFNAISALPTRNFSAASFEGADALSAEQVAELRQVARNSCASCSIGCEHRLSAQLRALPDSPGVYLFHDADGDVLYVGKAVSLRKRVQSYFRRDAIPAARTCKLKKKKKKKTHGRV